MADYISREAALYVHCAEADRGGCVDLPENGGYCRFGNRYCEEGKLFDNIPAADVIRKNIDEAVKFLTECGWMKKHDEEVIRSCVPKWELDNG